MRLIVMLVLLTGCLDPGPPVYEQCKKSAYICSPECVEEELDGEVCCVHTDQYGEQDVERCEK